MTAKAKVCKAKGCTRKTTNDHGYCWQHADMAELQKQKK